MTARPPPDVATGPLNDDFKFFIAHMSFDVTPSQLRQHFSQFGPVTFVKVLYDKHSGKSRGYGFVYMSTHAASQKVEAYSQSHKQRIEFGGRSNVFLARNDQKRELPIRNPIVGRNSSSSLLKQPNNTYHGGGGTAATTAPYASSSTPNTYHSSQPSTSSYAPSTTSVPPAQQAPAIGYSQPSQQTSYYSQPVAYQQQQQQQQQPYAQQQQGTGYRAPPQQQPSSGAYGPAAPVAYAPTTQQQQPPPQQAATTAYAPAQQQQPQPATTYAPAPAVAAYAPSGPSTLGTSAAAAPQAPYNAYGPTTQPTPATYATTQPAPITASYASTQPQSQASAAPYAAGTHAAAYPTNMTNHPPQAAYAPTQPAAPTQTTAYAPPSAPQVLQPPTAAAAYAPAPAYTPTATRTTQAPRPPPPPPPKTTTTTALSTKILVENLPLHTTPNNVVQTLAKHSVTVTRCTMDYNKGNCFAHVQVASTQDASLLLNVAQRSALVYQGRILKAGVDLEPPPDGKAIPVGMGAPISTGPRPVRTTTTAKDPRGRGRGSTKHHEQRNSRRDRPY